jgi:hypothetical protein
MFDFPSMWAARARNEPGRLDSTHRGTGSGRLDSARLINSPMGPAAHFMFCPRTHCALCADDGMARHADATYLLHTVTNNLFYCTTTNWILSPRRPFAYQSLTQIGGYPGTMRGSFRFAAPDPGIDFSQMATPTTIVTAECPEFPLTVPAFIY